LQPSIQSEWSDWSSAIEVYFRYEVKEVKSGVLSRVQPAHIEEESSNIRKVEPDAFYPKVFGNVLILRATKGLLSQDGLLLPEAVVERMVREIPNARRVDVDGTNHYAIVFQPNEVRDRAIRAFLEK